MATGESQPGGQPGYVFTEPAGGWRSEGQAAGLVDPAGVFAPVVSGSTIETGEHESGEDALFAEPPGGWSGEVSPVGHLVAPAGYTLDHADLSGPTAVGPSIETATRQAGPEYVFEEPPSGWSGTVEPVAELVDPDGLGIWATAISGRTIFASVVTGTGSGTARVDVFNEPAGGWSGQVRPSAFLDAGGAVLAEGRYAFVYDEVFKEPARGWSGTPNPVAFLSPPLTSAAAASGDTVVGFAGVGGCACSAFDAYTEPAGGWRGSVQPAETAGYTSQADMTALAVSGSTLFSTFGGNEIVVANIRGRSKSIPAPKLAGLSAQLAQKAPRLGFTLTMLPKASKLLTITITPPAGLRFTSNLKRPRAGVQVRGARLVLVQEVGNDLLAIRLTHLTASPSINVTGPTLIESQALEKRLIRLKRAGARDHAAHTVSLPLQLLLDTPENTWQLNAQLRAR